MNTERLFARSLINRATEWTMHLDAPADPHDRNPAQIEGLEFPGGSFTISRESNDGLAEASGGTAFAAPHLGFALVGTLARNGFGVEQLCRLCGASVLDGPLLAECRMTFRRPLRFDVEYRVCAKVVSVERKKSRRLGAMDLLRFIATLSEPGGVAVAEVLYSWVLPQRGVGSE
jgi:hypothetical protein